MTADDVFSRISAHMAQGLMFHDEMADYFDFLGLRGFKKEQEYHFFDEMIARRKYNAYFIEHCNKLVPKMDIQPVFEIPENWYSHVRQDVDDPTKRKSVSDGFSKWVEWETQTKALYAKSIADLCEAGNIAEAIITEALLRDVDNELSNAEAEMIGYEAYDLTTIMEVQEALHEKYAEKIGDLIE